MIPLMVRGQRIGLVILSSSLIHRWGDADLHPYQATAAQLAAAINSRRQHLLLVEHGRQLAVLEERRRLARELHDSVTQLIFSMTLIAQSIGPAWRQRSGGTSVKSPATAYRSISTRVVTCDSHLSSKKPSIASPRRRSTT